MKSISENIRSIFLADDDQDDRELFKEALHSLAPTAIFNFANHGNGVYDEVKKCMPDIVFMDLNMPGCDGRDCLRLLKADAQVAHIPVVIYSTSGARPWVDECFQLGATRYIVKPPSYKGILESVQLVLMTSPEELKSPPILNNFVINLR